MKIVKDENTQDAVPPEPMTAKLNDDGVIGWMGNFMAASGLTVIAAPDVTRDLLLLPDGTPTEAMLMIGMSMITNAVTLHMLQRNIKKRNR